MTCFKLQDSKGIGNMPLLRSVFAFSISEEHYIHQNVHAKVIIKKDHCTVYTKKHFHHKYIPHPSQIQELFFIS